MLFTILAFWWTKHWITPKVKRFYHSHSRFPIQCHYFCETVGTPVLTFIPHCEWVSLYSHRALRLRQPYSEWVCQQRRIISVEHVRMSGAGSFSLKGERKVQKEEEVNIVPAWHKAAQPYFCFVCLKIVTVLDFLIKPRGCFVWEVVNWLGMERCSDCLLWVI